MAGAMIVLDVSEVLKLNEHIADGMRKLLAGDPEQLLTDVGVELEGQTRERFESGRGPDGKAWEKWSDDYRARRPKQGSVLRLHGDLQGSITHHVSGNALQVGTRDVRAATHQYGDRRLAWGRVTVTYPARPFLDVELQDPQSGEEIGALIEDFVLQHGGGVL